MMDTASYHSGMTHLYEIEQQWGSSSLPALMGVLRLRFTTATVIRLTVLHLQVPCRIRQNCEVDSLTESKGQALEENILCSSLFLPQTMKVDAKEASHGHAHLL